ncbi:MAG: hypothetical protein B7Z39_02820 [Novosphingobium sp. 12-64-8]|nr:MAG: hypothetical protein B7Z39_02820 [Novosphingobium sp. 12-64-8]
MKTAARRALAMVTAGPMLALWSTPTFAGSKPYDATLTGYVVQQSGKSMSLGEGVVLKEHDVVFRGKLAWFDTATLATPVTFTAAGGEFTVVQTAVLRLAAKVIGGDLETLPKGTRTYCDNNHHNTAKGLANLASAGLLSLGARLRSDTQVCLVDKDANGDFESAFVIGIKKPEDRHLVDITPVTYTDKMLTPIEGDSVVEVEYLDGDALSGPQFSINMRVAGEHFQFAALHMFALRSGSIPMRVPSRQPVKAKKLPQYLSFGSAQLMAQAIDPFTRAATVDILSDFRLDGFVIQPLPQYLYIYY